MDYTTLRTELGQALGLDITDTTILANVKRWLNAALKDLQGRYRWHWLEKSDRFQTINVYTTGSVSVTINSRTVTGSGTAWTSAMVGRYFNCTANNNWYRIIAVGSVTSITLDKPYIDGTLSSAGYYIWKKYYSLNTDVKSLLDVHIEGWRQGLSRMPTKGGASRYSTYFIGIPSAYWEAEDEKLVTTYTTGTVTGTVNTRTLTGAASPSWLDNIRPGDSITIGTYTYHVESVDTDTQITLVEKLVAAVSAGTSYSALRERIKQIVLNYTPDVANNVTYSYIKQIYDLQNDSDIPDLPEKWHYTLILAAKWLSASYLDETREGQWWQEYEAKLGQMRREETSDGNLPQRWSWGA